MAKFSNNQIKKLYAGLLISLIVLVVVLLLNQRNSITVSREYDFGNDQTVEVVGMKNDMLRVEQNDKNLFQSQRDYEVNDFEIGDVNNDGEIELVIGFWRYGDFGKKLDYQQVRRGDKKSYHIYLYHYSKETNQFVLIWGSSTLPHPIYDFKIANQDGQNVLKVVEGSYGDYDKSGKIKQIKITYWIWNEWWFEEYKALSS